MNESKRIKLDMLRAQLTLVINDIHQTNVEYILERYTTPVAVLVSLERWQRIRKWEEQQKEIET